MAKNDYLKRQADRDKAFFDAGERVGMQKCWDYVQIALRDQDVMGKDVMGRKRMERVFNRAKDLADYFAIAFSNNVEADKKQEELDALLREIWGEDLSVFYERYPEIKKIRYDKPQKGWVD